MTAAEAAIVRSNELTAEATLVTAHVVNRELAHAFGCHGGLGAAAAGASTATADSLPKFPSKIIVKTIASKKPPS